ncbi:NIPSNAP family protein [Actinophytocola sp. KF-1]
MIIEIRTYRLRPGTADDFVTTMREKVVPLLRAAGIRVVDVARSTVAEDGHEEALLVRAFDSLAQHREQEDRFYRSDAWRTGPREEIVSRIEQYHSVVLEHPAWVTLP